MTVPRVSATSSDVVTIHAVPMLHTSSTTDTYNDSAETTAVFVGKQRYRVCAKLGDTLFGGVWLADDTHHDNAVVAIKQVVLQSAQHALTTITSCIDNPWVERRTLMKLAQLAPHANILQVHREFVEHGAWFVVMEYCDGGDLLGALQHAPNHRMHESQALPLFAQIVQGVRFLHANGIAHRDLSLENVLLRGETPKLCDFGLSTETNRVCDERVGKAYYMAPEVVAERAYDPAAADMWSLGIMLFIMLTGSPLTPSASEHEKAFRALRTFGVGKILEAWGMGSDFASSTVDLLEGLLQVDPAKRFSIADVVAHHALFDRLV